MKLSKKWGYGQLFGFSAVDGPNRYYEDHILMTMKKPLEFRYEFRPYFIKFNFPITGRITFDAVMSDFVIAHTEQGDFYLTYLDNDTLVGISPVLPNFKGEKELKHYFDYNVEIYNLGVHYLGIRSEKRKDGLFNFVIHHSFASTEARSGANRFIECLDVLSIIEKRVSYYKNMPKCLDKKYEALYYKALSVNKVNIHSPEGGVPLTWTTPDRVPHRHMWMWDSAFHALAMVTYNKELAKEIILAMLMQTRSNGFMPHMANPTDQSDVTQPCVMSFAVLKLYEETKDVEFIKKCLPYLEAYLIFDMENRDKNHNGLLEWYTEPNYTICKCGESGLDNSPRFDFDEEMDCIDFSTYFALDTKCLSELYELVGENAKAKKWKDISNKTADLINKYFWDEETGAYYDRLFSEKLTKVLTHSSFLPMFAGICSQQQAKKMVKTIFDKDLLYSTNPIASISQKDPRFSNDMWRGGVWLNLNYFVISGLDKYGFSKEAEELRNKTLEMVNKWYKKCGTIFEFYDPKDEVSPFMCARKGGPLKKPDYRKHVHSISDYNWSACFTLLLIQRKIY